MDGCDTTATLTVTAGTLHRRAETHAVYYSSTFVVGTASTTYGGTTYIIGNDFNSFWSSEVQVSAELSGQVRLATQSGSAVCSFAASPLVWAERAGSWNGDRPEVETLHAAQIIGSASGPAWSAQDEVVHPGDSLTIGL